MSSSPHHLKTGFVDLFSPDPNLDNSPRQVKDALYSFVSPTPVSNPKLIACAEPVARLLGLDLPTVKFMVDTLTGNVMPPGAKPYATRYGGYQFGHWAGQLGDGRALHLGEMQTSAGAMELQLKGAGPTPYSRGADGRAVLRSSVREYLCSEAMHYLGIPTTRALSLIVTGDQVIRDMFYDGRPRPEPGAIVCRVSPSFLRFGHFEILAASGEYALLKKLSDYVIQTFYRELDLTNFDIYGLFLDEVARRTAQMIVEWMRVGFVHGVMNTDNFSILGLTIDYGPYGWLEPYDPTWTPNTTDAARRRYRFGNQPAIGMWNVAQLTDAFESLIPDEARRQRSVEIYRETFGILYGRMLAQKLGLRSLVVQDGENLLENLFDLLHESRADYTLFFRSLGQWDALTQSTSDFWRTAQSSFYGELPLNHNLGERWTAWAARYQDCLRRDGENFEVRRAKMNLVNPKFVFRNYLAQTAAKAAEKGDYEMIHRLERVLKRPYDEQPDEGDLAMKRPAWAENSPGCSMLSCSS